MKRFAVVFLISAAAASLFGAKAPATVAPVSNTRIAGKPVLVPEVQQLKIGSGVFKLPAEFTVAVPKSESLIAEQLGDVLKRFGVKVVNADAAGAVCRFELVKEGVPEHPQGYTIVIGPEGIRIAARTGAGLFYGAQTLRNLIRNAAKPEIECLAASDWPDFDRRGYFLSIRSMKSEQLPAFKQSLDAMASLKMNWLLLGVEEAFPYQGNPLSKYKKPFTVAEMKDLAEFCRRRHIEITPTIQLWSHAHWMTFHPDWESKMSEGKPRKAWNAQCCPHSPEARELSERAIREQIELFRPKIFFLMLDEISHGPYGTCPRCKADPNLKATYAKFLKFLEAAVMKHGVRPMVCQDSFLPSWPYGKTLYDALDPQEMILWWSYRDQLPTATILPFRKFKLVGHSLTGKPFNTHNMLRLIRANGGRDSTLVYWYYSKKGLFLSPNDEMADSLGGFVNGVDYMWKFRETPYWELPYDGTAEMVRRLRPEKKVLDPRQGVWTPIPLVETVNTELGATGKFPVLGDKTLAELTKILAAQPEKFRLLTAPGGRYYALALCGDAANKKGRSAIQFPLGGRTANGFSLLMTASKPTREISEYRGYGYGKYRFTYAPAARLTVRYADGEKHTVQLRYRYDFADWNQPFGGFNTRFVVRGVDENAAHYRFCVQEFENPRPEVGIKDVTFSTARLDGIVPAILAMSLLDVDKPFAAAKFRPEAVSKNCPADGFGEAAEAKEPKIDWTVDFNRGMGKAKVVASGGFDPKAVKGEIIDDPTSPSGGKVLRIRVPKSTQREGGGFLRIDIDTPCRIAPDTKSVILEVQLPKAAGFHHSNDYLVAPDNCHHWGKHFVASTRWNVAVAPIALTKDLGAKVPLKRVDEAVLRRITFFFVTMDGPAEIRVGRFGTSPDTFSQATVWKLGGEAEAI